MQCRQSLMFVLALVGCMKPNPLIYTLGEDSTDSETGDGDPGDGDPGDGDPGDGDPSESETPPMDMPGGEMCEPLDPFSVGCGECLALGCCDPMLACSEVDQCLCLVECILGGDSPGKCKNDCGGVATDEIEEIEPLLACADESCAQEC